MSQVRIYQPTKTAMQSGRSRLELWILEYEPAAAKRADPLMGWIGSKDTTGQVRMSFKTLDDAVAFATSQPSIGFQSRGMPMYNNYQTSNRGIGGKFGDIFEHFNPSFNIDP